MTPRRKLAIAVPIALFGMGIVAWSVSESFRELVFFAMRGAYLAAHPAPPRCKQRAAELTAKVDVIKRDAENSLKIGAKKDAIVRFFASENIPLAFEQVGQEQEARGELHFKGLTECENMACGDDSAIIGVQVKVDSAGTIISNRQVIGMYTNCL